MDKTQTQTQIQTNQELYQWAKDIFPIFRCLTGDGVRSTLNYIKNIIPSLSIHSVESGKKVFDWEIPKEWKISEAYIEDESGNKIIDIKNNNLHVVGYSHPIDEWVSLDELNEHLHSLPDQPTAIPYITSYYASNWGFCIAHNQRELLKDKKYHVVIQSRLFDGVLNYGEILIPGKTKEEVLLSTYVCHPSMANNEVSGPVVATALARWLSERADNKYTYRIIFIPETIGSISYLSNNLHHLQSHVIAGFNITCVGDNNCYSFMPSRSGDTLSDRAAKHALHHIDKNFIQYSWLENRGSDERQYCAPGVDLPIASIMRSKYSEYDEYHTSLDNLDFISAEGLGGAFEALKNAIQAIEMNCVPRTKVLCEPQLGKRGLYPLISTRETGRQVKTMMNLISLSDGSNDLLTIAELINVSILDIKILLEKLIDNKILEKI
jgi:aminopeptidase-like protein